MLSNKIIALILLIGITSGAASPASPGQDQPTSSIKANVSQSAAAARATSASPKAKAASKTSIGSQKMTNPFPPAQFKQSSQSLIIRKAPSSAFNSKKEDAEDTKTSPGSLKAGRPLAGRIKRKKPSGFKEILKDEFDGPIHPVTTNNKDF